ncbi:MAG TPA: ATP-binding protein [Burkholderiaceae bacterium]|nr:ATP-binding protein [Burkholderiaceae bacterium]
MILTLRSKGMIALGVLVAYLGLVAYFVARERTELRDLVRQMEAMEYKHVVVTSIMNTLDRVLLDTQSVLNHTAGGEPGAAALAVVVDHVDSIAHELEMAKRLYPLLEQDGDALLAAVSAVRASSSRRDLEQMRDGEQQLIVKLHKIRNALQQRSTDLAKEYHDKEHTIGAVAIAGNVIGAGGTLLVVLTFFTRLATDIKRLRQRAIAIVGGYAGAPLDSQRRDEVGDLIAAVNRMQTELRRWEQKLELSWQQRVHQEKMAAVGSLAATIAHEVSNPIAAIAGVSQFIVDETAGRDDENGRAIHDFAVQIGQHSERITHIMRQMATMTAPRSPTAELLDLHALIRSTCGFVRYDSRLRPIEFELDLSHDIPAVVAVADHITQVLLNLLINAADAMEHLTAPGQARIVIGTHVTAEEVIVTVRDNGCGMTPEVLARAFDDSFTTKPAGKGRGIGLFVCKTLMTQAGGRIELASAPGVGTTATLHLPLRTDEAEGD